MKKLILLICMFALILPACSDDGGNDDYVDSLNYDNYKEAEEAADEIKITCEDEKDCPEFIGGLYSITTSYKYDYFGSSKKYANLGVCSQTLISPNQVLTNRHCLPDSFKYKGSRCGTIKVVFPKSGKHKAEKIQCKSVVDLSDKYSTPGAMHPDWAILELEKSTQRKHVSINTNGIPQNSKLFAYPVYFKKLELDMSTYSTTATVKGQIRKVSCTSEMGSVLSLFYKHPQSSVFGFYCDQKVIKGNSGSGVFSATRRLNGVLSMGGGSADGTETKLGIMGREYKVSREFSGGTNAHCISEFNPTPSKACVFGKNPNGSIAVSLILSIVFGQEISADVNREYNDVLATDPTIEWENFNEQLFSKIYQNKTHRKSIGNLLTDTVADYIFNFDTELRFPQTPLCIDSSRKQSGQFLLKIPYFSGSLKNVSLDKRSVYNLPLELKTLAFEMIYQKRTNSFVGQFAKLPKDAQTSFSDLKKTGDSELQQKCLFSKYPSSCYQTNILYEKIDDYKINSGLEDYLFNNAEFNGDNELTAPQLELPVCD